MWQLVDVHAVCEHRRAEAVEQERGLAVQGTAADGADEVADEAPRQPRRIQHRRRARVDLPGTRAGPRPGVRPPGQRSTAESRSPGSRACVYSKSRSICSPWLASTAHDRLWLRIAIAVEKAVTVAVNAAALVAADAGAFGVGDAGVAVERRGLAACRQIDGAGRIESPRDARGRAPVSNAPGDPGPRDRRRRPLPCSGRACRPCERFPRGRRRSGPTCWRCLCGDRNRPSGQDPGRGGTPGFPRSACAPSPKARNRSSRSPRPGDAPSCRASASTVATRSFSSSMLGSTRLTLVLGHGRRWPPMIARHSSRGPSRAPAGASGIINAGDPASNH